MSRLGLCLALLLTIIVSYCGAYKILAVFPLPGKSHLALGNGFVNSLLKAGHEITYITPFPIKNATNLRQIDVSSNQDMYPGEGENDVANITRRMNKNLNVKVISNTLSFFIKLSNASVLHENVQKLINNRTEQFDLVIVEWMHMDFYSGFSSVFNCPYIWSSSMDPHPLVLSLIDEIPNPAYSPGHLYTSNLPPYTFWQRVTELYNVLNGMFKKWLISGDENKIFTEAFAAAVAARGRTLPPLDEVKYNASLMFGNSHASLGQALRLPPNYVPIAGYHIDDELEPLNKKLKKVMDGAKNGVIYFSMGSILKGNSLPETIQKDLLDMFGRLNYTVIWKFKENITVPYSHVHVVNWAPQQSILAHPKCILFITHGGILSIIEAIHYGVPIIGLPIFADQFINVNKAIHNGYAKKIDLKFDTLSSLELAIKEMILNPKYRERVKELSHIFLNRPISPRQELVHWVEHVILTRGAPHLRSPALFVPWYQKMYLDLLFLINVLVIFLILIIAYYFRSKKDDTDLMKKWI